MREQAVFALGQIRDRRAVEPLISALKDPAPDVREQAAFALGQIRDKAAVDALMVAVKDADKDVREQVVFALGQLRDPESDRRAHDRAQRSERRRPQAGGVRPRTTRSITPDALPAVASRPPRAVAFVRGAGFLAGGSMSPLTVFIRTLAKSTAIFLGAGLIFLNPSLDLLTGSTPGDRAEESGRGRPPTR